VLYKLTFLIFVCLLQAPYLVYVEVVECDNVTTEPLPSKLLDTAIIRCAHSEDDIACCNSVNRSPRTVESNPCSDVPLMEYDETEEWSLEDDDIIQASCATFLSCCKHVCCSHVINANCLADS